jgi:hypothetical protein
VVADCCSRALNTFSVIHRHHALVCLIAFIDLGPRPGFSMHGVYSELFAIDAQLRQQVDTRECWRDP